MKELRGQLEALYRRYNRRSCVHPDPLEFLYRYKIGEDREIAGLIASSLAYGRVAYILKSVGAVLDRLQPTPSAFLDQPDEAPLREVVRAIQHRWTTARDLADLLISIRRVRQEHGSLQAAFAKGLQPDHETVMPALAAWIRELKRLSRGRGNRMLADPSGPSACKRLHLFLRWMVRRDEVDPGGWDEVPASKLIIPLDVHMHRIARVLGFTQRLRPDGRAALEVTAAFRKIVPDDPVRFDFALTRLPIHDRLKPDDIRRLLVASPLH